MNDPKNSTKTYKVHPEEQANPISNFFFTWQIVYFVKYLRNVSGEDELFKPAKQHESQQLGDRIEHLWNKEVEHYKNKASFWRVLAKLFGKKVMLLGFFLFFIDTLAMTCQSYAIYRILDLITLKQSNYSQINDNVIYFWVAFLVLFSFIGIIVRQNCMVGLTSVGVQVKVACSSLIYRKALKMGKTATSVGQIVNIIANDITNFEHFAIFAPFLFSWMFSIAVAGYFLYLWTTPMDCIDGVAVFAFFSIVQFLLCRKVKKNSCNISKATDKRLRLVNELISSIQIIKMYTWEKPFTKIVNTARKLELKELTAILYLKGFFIGLKLFLHKIAFTLSLLLSVLNSYRFDTKSVYTAINFYYSLRMTITVYLSRAIWLLGDTQAAVSRIENFLLNGEIQPIARKTIWRRIKNVEKTKDSVGIIRAILESPPPLKVGIYAKNVSAKWNKDQKATTLTRVNFAVEPGNLVAVIGASGSGKTTLLHVLQKEISILEGELEINGRISFASQEPWIFPGSVKQNVLFGSEMDDARYKEVLRVCALERDLALWPDGDGTLVGDRGILLSGGQKSRINLARAVYKRAEIYLLDDPLSAVDAQVANHLSIQCFSKFLRDKCVVLVTHQLQLLRNVRSVYLLKNGEICLFRQNEPDDLPSNNVIETFIKDAEYAKNIIIKKNTEINKTSCEKTNPLGSYSKYCQAAGGKLATSFLLVIFCVLQLLMNLADYFVALWINQHENYFDVNNNLLYTYLGLLLLIILTIIARSYLNVKYCIRASRSLHESMFHTIVLSKMRFFYRNSTGVILSRFSRDMGVIDHYSLDALMNSLAIIISTVAIPGLVCILNNWAVGPTLILYLGYYGFLRLFFKISERVEKLESSTKTPVFTHLTTSLRGLTTIRAYGAENKLQEEFDELQDRNSAVYYFRLALQRGFTFWVDCSTVLYQTVVIFGIVYFRSSDQIVANIGLVITQLITLTPIASLGILFLNILDKCMISAERVLEYSEIQREEDFGENGVEDSWPSEGKIKFESISMKYAVEDSLVIKNVTLEIQAREKVGIVGRTGAGKSSLISIIFRLCDFGGKVLIDGIDTKTIGLGDLRSRISIIPQDPVLFSGTVRSNLDPCGDYDDFKLWEALEDVRLKSTVSLLPSGLESVVNEGGDNFSIGQRQLLCLARVILRNNKILVLDEATSNIDLKTDNLIQETIKRKFSNCTVITIAHRLSTIMNSDRILVMENGRAVEFDRPLKLLQDSQGLFYQFVNQNKRKTTQRMSQIVQNSVT